MFTRAKAKRWVAMLSLFAFVGCSGSDGPKDTQEQEEPKTQEPTPKDKKSEPGDSGDNEESASSTTGQEPGDSSSKSGGGSGDSSGETPDDKSSSGGNGDGKIDCSALKVSGTGIGEVPKNLELMDAQGNKVSLHEHCNDVLYLAAATAY